MNLSPAPTRSPQHEAARDMTREWCRWYSDLFNYIKSLADAASIQDAKADSSTKGVATFNATDFNDNGSGLISIDNTRALHIPVVAAEPASVANCAILYILDAAPYIVRIKFEDDTVAKFFEYEADPVA